MLSLGARLGSLSLESRPASCSAHSRAARPCAVAASLSSRRSESLSAGSLQLARVPPARKAFAAGPLFLIAGNGVKRTKLKTRKSAAKRFKVTASGKVGSLERRRRLIVLPCSFLRHRVV